MRTDKLRSLFFLLVLLIFTAGLTLFLYPYFQGAAVDRQITTD